MSGIRVAPDQLRERAQEYDKQGALVGDVIKSLDNLISILESEWEGNSARRYISQYQELKPSFTSMQELIADLATSLRQEADKWELADR